jgi:DNA-binding MarR family transcriptional regulator
MASEEDLDWLMKTLIDMGAIVEQPSRYKEGEVLYHFTSECEEIFPELYAVHLEAIDNIANELWQMGLIEITFGEGKGEKGDLTSMTPENRVKYESVKSYLSEDQLHFMDILLRKFLF